MSLQQSILKPVEPGIDLVGIISEGTYTSFAQALKEFISNAFDACASRVDIDIDDECQNVIIRDNGTGMNTEDFTLFFGSIARCSQTPVSSCRGLLKKPRNRIGKFGIGALCVAAVADKFIVRSTKYRETQGFEAEIDLKVVREYFRKNEGLSEHWKFRGTTWSDTAEQHFTEIHILGLRRDIASMLQAPGERNPSEFYDSVCRLSGIEQLRWKLGVICNVGYGNRYPLDQKLLNKTTDAIVISRSKDLLANEFEVFLNKIPVLRPISLPMYHPKKLGDAGEAKRLLKRGLGFDLVTLRSSHGAAVEYDGYIVSQAMQVFPKELRGILVRMRGVAVGWHRTLYVPGSISSTFKDSMSGEIWVEKGLDEALQFDRESFREDHPLFVEFCQQIGEILGKEGNRFRRRSTERLGKAPRESISKRIARAEKPVPVFEFRPPTTIEKTTDSDQLFPTDILKDDSPQHIRDVAYQINGCWNHGYLEACAVMIRRLLQTLIMLLYDTRGCLDRLYDKEKKRYYNLKTMIDMLNGDAQFRVDREVIEGLEAFKELGDIAAHDHRVRIRKREIEERKNNLAHTAQRLLYIIEQNRQAAGT